MYRNIPTYDCGEWTTTEFESIESFREFIDSIFFEPGKYALDKTSLMFNEEAKRFTKQGFYCDKPVRSKDFMTYWEDQKNKCREGVIYKNKKDTWYITRDYYMWLNFLPIFDKEEKHYGFAKIRDGTISYGTI